MEGRRFNVVMLMVLVVATMLQVCSTQVTYVVGDAMGWTIPSSEEVGYQTWAAARTFVVGDVLVFNFETGIHDVNEVTKASFDSCNTTNLITMFSVGPARINLDANGEHHYICSFGNHCGAGQKLAINVSTNSGVPAQHATPPSIFATVPALQPSTPPSIFAVPKKRHKWLWWTIPALVGAFLLLVCILCISRKYKRKAFLDKNKMVPELVDTTMMDNGISKGKNHEMNKIHQFSFQTIQMATSDFSMQNKLGEGGFGPVYKGKLPDGQEIAIKRLSKTSSQGLEEFKNEIQLIVKLQHINLVRLLGCCIHQEEMMLVYEYMPNKSLDFYLFDPRKGELLKWVDRMNIIEGIAQGLLYLHRHSRLRVIHRDLKASNILLDLDMTPKISDFGMARIFGMQDSEANTKRIVGTRGYMSPEYAINGVVSTKIDVFSFGVLILEIVSGKKNHKSYLSERPLNLIGLAWELWEEGRALDLVDTTLNISNHQNEVQRCINVGLLCVQDSATVRPSMADVILMLQNELLQLPIPKKPAFFMETGATYIELEESQEINCTSKLPTSIMEAR